MRKNNADYNLKWATKIYKEGERLQYRLKLHSFKVQTCENMSCHSLPMFTFHRLNLTQHNTTCLTSCTKWKWNMFDSPAVSKKWYKLSCLHAAEVIEFGRNFIAKNIKQLHTWTIVSTTVRQVFSCICLCHGLVKYSSHAHHLGYLPPFSAYLQQKQILHSIQCNFLQRNVSVTVN